MLALRQRLAGRLSSFWAMTHSTLFWFVILSVVGLFFLARAHTSTR